MEFKNSEKFFAWLRETLKVDTIEVKRFRRG
jgi:hypothetical protein